MKQWLIPIVVALCLVTLAGREVSERWRAVKETAFYPLLMRCLSEANHYIRLPDESESLLLALFHYWTTLNLVDLRSFIDRELVLARSTLEGEVAEDVEPIESAPPLADVVKPRPIEPKEVKKWPKQQVVTKAKQPRVYIYHTHSRESYLPLLQTKNPNAAFHETMNVMKVGTALGQALTKRRIATLVSRDDFTGRLVKRKWPYYYSYRMSRETLQLAKRNIRSLRYFIDIHRDSRRKKQTTVIIKGKPYAQVAFVVGGDHPRYMRNYQFSLRLHRALQKRYPELSRGIMVKRGKGTDGVFNQDLAPEAILIEFGGVDNTAEELIRSANAVAEIVALEVK